MHSFSDVSYHQRAMDLIFYLYLVLDLSTRHLEGLDSLWTHIEAYCVGYLDSTKVGDLSSSNAAGLWRLWEEGASDLLQEVAIPFLGITTDLQQVSYLWIWDIAYLIQASFEAYFGALCWHSWSGCWLFGIGLELSDFLGFMRFWNNIENSW